MYFKVPTLLFFFFSQNLNQASVIVGQYDDIYHEIYFSASLYAPWSVSLYLYLLGFQAFSRQDGFIAIFDYLMRFFFCIHVNMLS